jgi:RNA polymerase II subunit A C-terminal domain phosphatase SSU72
MNNFYRKRGFDVQSFGSGNQVKLPGPSPDRPNIYDFGTSYNDIYNDLASKDKTLLVNTFYLITSTFLQDIHKMVC